MGKNSNDRAMYNNQNNQLALLSIRPYIHWIPSNNLGPNSYRTSRELPGLSSVHGWWLQGLALFFEHLELDRSSIYITGPFQRSYHRLFIMNSCHYWHTFSDTTVKCLWSFHTFFVFLEISGWLNKLDRERITCYYWNCNLSFWELFQTSFSNHKSLWRN